MEKKQPMRLGIWSHRPSNSVTTSGSTRYSDTTVYFRPNAYGGEPCLTDLSFISPWPCLR